MPNRLETGVISISIYNHFVSCVCFFLFCSFLLNAVKMVPSKTMKYDYLHTSGLLSIEPLAPALTHIVQGTKRDTLAHQHTIGMAFLLLRMIFYEFLCTLNCNETTEQGYNMRNVCSFVPLRSSRHRSNCYGSLFFRRLQWKENPHRR